jgi:hypothetical protein
LFLFYFFFIFVSRKNANPTSPEPKLYRLVTIPLIIVFFSFFAKETNENGRFTISPSLWTKGKVLANGTRNFPLDTYRDTHNSRSEQQQQQRIKLPARGRASQPASFFLFFSFLFLSQVKRTEGGLQTSSCFTTTTMGPFFSLVRRFIASIKRILKNNKKIQRERERQQHYRLRYLLLNYYSSAGWSGFSNRL